MSFEGIEDPKSSKKIMADTSTSDIFKHENGMYLKMNRETNYGENTNSSSESVDLLLKELNQDPDDINDIINRDSISLNNSPTKPLKFLTLKAETNSTDNLSNTKEFNSSSDTYTSETELSKDTNIKLEEKQSVHMLHDRTSRVDEDEFSFATPMTSTANLHNPETKIIGSTSPSKSIMKKTPGNSPKKSVVFTNSNPEIHHYENENTSSNEIEESNSPMGNELPIESEWNELSQESDENLSPAPIPPPPPHKTSNFISLLNMSSEDDVDSETLQQLKSKSKNFSNLSLNEKLDIYLTNNQQQHLDQHLNDLHDARKLKTESNIHNLLSNIQNPSQDEVENPLESFMKNTDVQIRSAGSSQSSLQSLVNDNRMLNSVNIPIMNKGTKINNGIRGIPDDIVGSVVPTTNQEPIEDDDEGQGEEEEEEVEKGVIMMRGSKVHKFESESSSDDETYHDSFDQTNGNTEKSIMNLLMTSNNEVNNIPSIRETALHSNDNEEIPDEELIKRESSNDNILNENDINKSEHVGVKQETSDSIFDNQPQIKLKEEKEEEEEEEEGSNGVQNSASIKGESDDNIMDHSNHTDYGEGMKLELVSGFGKASGGNAIKLVRTNVNGKRELPTNDHSNESDISESVNNSTQVSLRFHMDSDWKLEDSNDGDREDNDDFTHNELTTINHRYENQEIERKREKKSLDRNELDNLGEIEEDISISSATDEFRDASDIISQKSLAPPRFLTGELDSETCIDVDKDEDEDENALANSSNIAPPEELTLPVIDTNNYSSFEEITKNIDISSNSFEESLSAEHDDIKTPINYISIWHSQDSQKKKPRKISNSKTRILENIQHSDSQQSGTPKLLSEMNKRKFKEINVTSRRVVSPGSEDINISAFLPELSEDSGFENHFKFLRNNVSVYNYSTLSQGKISKVNTNNILSNIKGDEDLKSSEFSNSDCHKESVERKSLKPLQNDIIFKHDLPKNKGVSKFRVPSFDIQRSNSILSPRNKYDDIFEDVLQEKPTIVSKGMKTLPSMDRNDVQRILNAKKVITQDEFANVKLGNHSKYSVISGSYHKYDELQQHASIYNASPESTAIIDDGVLPHLANELLKSPGNLLAKDQYFNVYVTNSNNDVLESNNSQLNSRISSVQKSQVPTNSYFPDPDPELTCSPEKEVTSIIPSQKTTTQNIQSLNPFLEFPIGCSNTLEAPGNSNNVTLDPPTTPVIETNGKLSTENNNLGSSAFNTPVNDERNATSSQNSPVKKKSPIKIGSPIKLVKKGSKVTGITTESSPLKKHNQNSPSYIGAELNNQKVRNSPSKSYSETRQLSTVSVPSIYSNKSSLTGKTVTKSKEIQNHSDAKEDQISKISHTPRERGKLFFKVNGIKNIGLPDILSHNAEFSLTLDNGVHCIKTPNYRMAKNVQIGKEFELTVGNSLEFIITLKSSYDKPRDKLVEVKERKVVRSKNRISRIFGSKSVITTTKFISQESKDNWKNKFAQDGSFARCYVDLNQFQEKIYCKAVNFDLNCFNEWEITSSSGGNFVKCKPYRIGQLEVTMLYIPRSDEIEVLPTSIRLAYDITQETKQDFNARYEGYLHQEGGDCEVWKRRFFKLEGTSLIAHSEFSHKTRAKINLAKIVEVLYFDEENVTNASNKHRNFSDLLLVQHSFKIRFANGEVIDFSAPSKEEKLKWISILEEIIRRNRLRQQPWVNLMIENQAAC